MVGAGVSCSGFVKAATIDHPSQLDLAEKCAVLWKCLNVVHLVESLHAICLVEGHIRTNRLRVHLEGVHRLI